MVAAGLVPVIMQTTMRVDGDREVASVTVGDMRRAKVARDEVGRARHALGVAFHGLAADDPSTTSPAAPWKFGLIAVAGLNILICHTGVYCTVKDWDLDAWPPFRAQLAAIVSAASWMGVIVAGRFLAY